MLPIKQQFLFRTYFHANFISMCVNDVGTFYSLPVNAISTAAYNDQVVVGLKP